MNRCKMKSSNVAYLTNLYIEEKKKVDNIHRAIKTLDKIILNLVCIGGPLNDNILQYTPEQRKIFHRIEEYVNEAISELKYGDYEDEQE